MSKTAGVTDAPPVNGVPEMFTLMPPVAVNKQFPDLSRAAWSWYCHRAVVAGVQHAPAWVLQATGKAQPADPQSASALGVRDACPAIRKDATSSSTIGTGERFIRNPFRQ